MKSNSINWRLVWQFGTMLCISMAVCFYVQMNSWKMSGDSEKVTAEQFASFYLATPGYKLDNLRGWGTCSYSETLPKGYIYFDCDEAPILNDANSYETGGDSIALTDKFLQQFGKNAYALLHSDDVICLRMKEDTAISRRFLLHNRKTKQYFFARL